MCIDIVRRLKIYMEHVGLPNTQFADYAKIARPTISQLLNGRNRKVSNELISKLHDAFPELNIMWLMFGDGEMLVKSSSATDSAPTPPNLFSATMSTDAKQSSNENTAPHIAVRTGSLDDLVNSHSAQPAADIAQKAAMSGTDMSKRIKSIMVFYTDSSFEIFTPSNF